MQSKIKFYLLCLSLLMTSIIRGQSTSNWIKVKSGDVAGPAISKQSSYVTLKVLNTKIFHKSNWWSQLVGKNKKAFFTIDVAALYANGTKAENRWSSDLVSIERKQEPIEIGWSQTLVNVLPTTFTNLKVNITLGYNSVDGIDNVVSIVSDLSKTVPPLAPVQSAFGAISGTKALLDELFNKRLADSYLKSNNDLMPSSQNALDAGYYVIFGEQTASAYQKYKNDSNDLFWNGHDLLFKNLPINDVNYVIIALESIEKLFVKKDMNILTNTDLPWVKFYLKANQLIDSWSVLSEEEKVKVEIRENLAAAKAVLDNDPTFVFQEKEDIHKELGALFFAKRLERKQAIISGAVLMK